MKRLISILAVIAFFTLGVIMFNLIIQFFGWMILEAKSDVFTMVTIVSAPMLVICTGYLAIENVVKVWQKYLS